MGIVKGQRTTFAQSWKKLLADLKPMNWKQRIDHIWTYYKEVMFLCGFGIVILCAIFGSLINANREILSSGMLVNIAIEQKGFDYLSTEYFEDLGAKEGKQIVELDYANFSDLEDLTKYEENYNATMVLVGLVSAKRLDFMILDQTGMEFYIPQEVYMDLTQFFTAEELEALGDKLIYAREEEETEPMPVAVDISDLDYVKDNITTEGKIYFALSGSTQRMETCRDVWNRIHAWKGE